MSTATVSETLGVKQRKSRKSKNDTFLPASTPGVPRISREPNGEHLTIGCSKEGIVLVHSIDNTNEDSAEQKPMKEKKRKRTTEEAQVEKSDDAQSKKKSRSEKAFKRERKEGRKERSGQAQAPDDKLELEKKKKRNRNVNLPDPEDDTSLTDQAHRGLSYAFLQLENPGAWKFSKARQNWLIRNVWSEQLVPDIYMPLVLKYLANVKGGIRENLIQQCREARIPSVSALPADPPRPTPKQQRAQAILGALGVAS